MTVRPSPLVPSGCRLRTTLALAFAVGTSTLFSADARAQNNAAAGNSGTGSNATAGDTAAAADAGSTLTERNVFSSTSDTVGTIGNNDGRFGTSRLGTQPTAGGNTATTQNAANQFRNL